MTEYQCNYTKLTADPYIFLEKKQQILSIVHIKGHKVVRLSEFVSYKITVDEEYYKDLTHENNEFVKKIPDAHKGQVLIALASLDLDSMKIMQLYGELLSGDVLVENMREKGVH